MSLILEALNRARREQHNAGPVPGVDSEHFYPSAAAANPWRQRGLLAALALSLLVIGVLLVREFSRDGTELPAEARERQTAVGPATLPQAPAPQAAAPSTAAAPEPAVEQAAEAAGSTGASEETAVVSAPALSSALAQPTLPETTGTGISAEVAALYQQPAAPEEVPEAVTTTTPAAANGEAVDIASLVTAAEQALEDVRLAEHSAPFLGELSQQRKDAVPTLMYLQHDYRTEGGSTVTINGQSAGAGQAVGRGVQVEEILPDSVVLSHDGQQFRLRALNSWVNL